MIRKLAALIALALIWDGIRWVRQAVQPPAIPDVGAAVAEELAAAAAPAERVRYRGPAEQVRDWAAAQVAGRRVPDLEWLPEHQQAWVRGLTPAELATVAGASVTTLGRHLDGSGRIAGVSQVLSADAYRERRMQALAAAEQAALVRLDQDEETVRILTELMADEPETKAA